MTAEKSNEASINTLQVSQFIKSLLASFPFSNEASHIKNPIIGQPHSQAPPLQNVNNEVVQVRGESFFAHVSSVKG